MAKEQENISLLISALRQGDQYAFAKIYDIYINALKSFVNSYTKSYEQTNDILQDTFIKLWNSREDLDLNKSVKSLLFKTSYNIYIDKYRKRQREINMLDGWKYKCLIEMSKNDEDEGIHKLKLVEEAIEKLPPKCKEVFLLSKYEELKYKEIANQLNVSIKTVEVQMGKAFRIIRDEINKKTKPFLFILLSNILNNGSLKVK